eukprot:112278-Chlamydomonas_euryale.AAC.2
MRDGESRDEVRVFWGEEGRMRMHECLGARMRIKHEPVGRVRSQQRAKFLHTSFSCTLALLGSQARRGYMSGKVSLWRRARIPCAAFSGCLLMHF